MPPVFPSEPDGIGSASPRVIVIGASAGGVDALRKIAAGLPAQLPASVFIVQHTYATSPRLLADILARAGDIKVTYAEEGQPFEAGHVYVAPPDQHLLLEAARMRLVRGPKENSHRPAIDPLFRSAAVHHGPNAIGVILTGYLNDGASGLAAVKQCGGQTVVQSPGDALVPDMPSSALRHVAVDHCLPLADIPELLVRLAATSVNGQRHSVPESIRIESGIAEMENPGMRGVDKLGRRSTLTCPDCGGVLWEMQDQHPPRFRCHVGHAMTADVLAAGQAEAVERALWLALKTLEESAALAMRLASSATDDFSKELFSRRAEKAGADAAKLREILLAAATA